MKGLGVLTPKSLHSHNPIPRGCVLYLPLWSPGLRGPVFKSIDPFGRTCTVTSAVKKDKGRDFDGSDDTIALGTDIFTQADFATGLTMGFWFKVEALDDIRQSLLTLEDVAYLDIAATTDIFGFNIYDGAGQLAPSNGAVSTATWYCVFGTWDATTMTLYIGSTSAPVAQSVTDTATVPILDTNSRTNAIGSDRSGTGNWYEGLMGDVWIYNRALTLLEIQYVYGRTRGKYQ